MTEPLEGQISVAKRLLNNAVWQRSDYGWAWVTLLLLANDKTRTLHLSGQRVEVKRGQLAWSLTGLQKKMGKGRKWLDTFLDFCKEEGMVTVQIFAHGAIITILNYDVYNPKPAAINEPAKAQAEAPAEGQGKEQAQEQGEVQADSPQNREFKKGNGAPLAPLTGPSEIPSDLEVETFCSSFTDMARGITRIPEVWWRGWLSLQASKTRFPADWKYSLRQAFLGDWSARHPKALGLEIKNGATTQARAGMRERGELLQLISAAKSSGQDTTELRKELEACR